jgi:4'-phosphopantetheinyl transferase
MATTWEFPPEEVQLQRSQVHIWRVWLDAPSHQIETLKFNLSEAEIRRAEKFHFLKDRNRFLAAHNYTRQILGRYLDLAPEQILYTYNDHGKPDIDHKHAPGPLHFNLSHSDSVCLLAVSNEMQLGVDVERVKHKENIEEIAQRFFSPGEVEQLFAQPESHRDEAFFRCWTRKEAYIKAHGGGMSIPLDQFEVTFISGVPPKINHIGGNVREAARWTLYHLNPREGFIGALAVEGQPIDLKFFQWPGWPES